MSFWLLVDVLFEIPGFLRVRSHHYPPINSSTLADRVFQDYFPLNQMFSDVFRVQLASRYIYIYSHHCFQGPIYIYINLPEANPIVPWYPHFQRRVTQLPFFSRLERKSAVAPHLPAMAPKVWVETGGWAKMDIERRFHPGNALPSGNLLHSYWKWPFIVDFPIKNGDVQ